MSNEMIAAKSRSTILTRPTQARTTASDTPQTRPMPSPDVRFLAGTGALFAAWEARLRAEGSAMVRNAPVWERCLVRAFAIVAECALQLAGADRPTGPAGWLGLPRPNAGTLCAAQEIGLPDVLRAGTVFAELATRHLHDCVADAPDGLRLLSGAVLTLHRAVAASSQETARSYDRFLADRIAGVRAGARRGLSREVHDHVGNGVSLAHRHLEMYDALRGRDDATADRKIAQARFALNEAMENIRRLVSDLRPQQVGSGVAEAVERYVASVDLPGTEVDLRVDGDEWWIPDDVAGELFTVVREALRNVFAHAQASRVTVRIVIRPDDTQVCVEDDGTGFGIGTRHDDFGLTSMAERVDALGGRFDIWSQPGMGTRVQAWVPNDGRTR